MSAALTFMHCLLRSRSTNPLRPSCLRTYLPQERVSNLRSRTPTGAVYASTRSSDEPSPDKEQWQIQKESLKQKFGEEGWKPRKRLSPDALEGIRHLHASNPEQYSTAFLANQFEVSPEAIRRILKSKWQPSDVELQDRRQRWERRGESVWKRKMELGLKPPRKWRDLLQASDQDHVVIKEGAGMRHDERGDGQSKAKARSPAIPLSSRIL